ncbi:MAG TPA: thioredoxin family protein [Thermoanaerobaculia bacterium]|nr:thioredoxin family protein [Thermoanaerobaculia bacterium]
MPAHARLSASFLSSSLRGCRGRSAGLAVLAVITLSAIAAQPAQAAAGRTVKVSDRTFQDQVLRAGMPVLVAFGAPWCQPCRKLEGSLGTVAAELAGRVRIVELDASSSRRVAQRYGVEALPTLILFVNGQPLEHATGALSVDEIKDLLTVLAPAAQRPVATVAEAGAAAASATR